MGGELADRTLVTPKYIGRRRLMEIAVATLATDRDRGVNDISSALRRRFNTVVLPLPATAREFLQRSVRQRGQETR